MSLQEDTPRPRVLDAELRPLLGPRVCALERKPEPRGAASSSGGEVLAVVGQDVGGLHAGVAGGWETEVKTALKGRLHKATGGMDCLGEEKEGRAMPRRPQARPAGGMTASFMRTGNVGRWGSGGPQSSLAPVRLR